MLLAIDIGNTNITMGVWDGRAWRRTWRLITHPLRTTDEYGITLHTFLREARIDEKVAAVILASVVPALTTTFTAVSRHYLNTEPLVVTVDLDLGLRVETAVPTAVGADRLVNAIAAQHLRPGPAVIIDMGTATKLDVVTGDGRFIGGVIAPGLQLAADALFSRAAKLSHVVLEAPPTVIGRDTETAMQSGIIYGYAALVSGLLDADLRRTPASRAADHHPRHRRLHRTDTPAPAPTRLCRPLVDTKWAAVPP
jgi:type III pantothenate kinase